MFPIRWGRRPISPEMAASWRQRMADCLGLDPVKPVSRDPIRIVIVDRYYGACPVKPLTGTRMGWIVILDRLQSAVTLLYLGFCTFHTGMNSEFLHSRE